MMFHVVLVCASCVQSILAMNFPHDDEFAKRFRVISSWT